MHNLPPWHLVAGSTSYSSHFVVTTTTLYQNSKGGQRLRTLGLKHKYKIMMNITALIKHLQCNPRKAERARGANWLLHQLMSQTHQHKDHLGCADPQRYSNHLQHWWWAAAAISQYNGDVGPYTSIRLGGLGVRLELVDSLSPFSLGMPCQRQKVTPTKT